MQPEKIGQFIAELRKSRHMTQRALAEQLNITDKAVSKWERGLSCPDISLLNSLAEVLGVSVVELLNGERSDGGGEAVKREIDSTLQYADETMKHRVRSLRGVYSLAFTIVLLLGMLVCVICDMAITKELSWSLIVISSCILAWLVFFPAISYGGRKGIVGMLVMLSVVIIPYLYIFSCLVGETEIIRQLIRWIGFPVAVILVVYLWGICVIFRKLRNRITLATAISLLLAIPVSLFINLVLSWILNVPVMDEWDILSLVFIAVVSAVLFWRNSANKIK